MADSVRDINNIISQIETLVENNGDLAFARQGRKAQLALLAMLTLTVRSLTPLSFKLKPNNLTQEESALTQEERDSACMPNTKISTVKKVRNRLDCSLREAIDIVERYMKHRFGFTHWPELTADEKEAADHNRLDTATTSYALRCHCSKKAAIQKVNNYLARPI